MINPTPDVGHAVPEYNTVISYYTWILVDASRLALVENRKSIESIGKWRLGKGELGCSGHWQLHWNHKRRDSSKNETIETPMTESRVCKCVCTSIDERERESQRGRDVERMRERERERESEEREVWRTRVGWGQLKSARIQLQREGGSRHGKIPPN